VLCVLGGGLSVDKTVVVAVVLVAVIIIVVVVFVVIIVLLRRSRSNRFLVVLYDRPIPIVLFEVIFDELVILLAVNIIIYYSDDLVRKNVSCPMVRNYS